MAKKSYSPSPWGKTTTESETMLEDRYRRQYQGQFATLDGKPARVMPIEGGRAAAVIGPAQSGEASWFKVHEVMTKREGKFKLERGHLAV